MLRTKAMLVCLMVSLGPAALGQDAQERQRRYYEELRREQERQEQQRRAQQREAEHQSHLEDRARDPSRYGPAQGAGGRSSADPGGQLTFSNVATGIAVVAISAFVLDTLFGTGGKRSAAPAAPARQGDPSARPQQFDTPDGRIAKVCFWPASRGEPQAVTYRWDAPNETAREVEIPSSRDATLFQLTHPTATHLFVHIAKPVENHRPSEGVYRLEAYRIADAGCRRADAFQIVYPVYGGPARIVRAL